MYYHNLCMRSNAAARPKKPAPFAGKALNKAGPNPLNNAPTPSLRIICKPQSTKPL
jgi:hypothetical protein